MDNIIHSYTRAEAIEDGFLVDVSDTAKEAGFLYPVALTATVYRDYVEVPEGVEGQDESGRLWDILFLCRHKIKRSNGGTTCFFYLLVKNDNNKDAERVRLKAVCGANDDASPCITVMMPDED